MIFFFCYLCCNCSYLNIFLPCHTKIFFYHRVTEKYLSTRTRSWLEKAFSKNWGQLRAEAVCKSHLQKIPLFWSRKEICSPCPRINDSLIFKNMLACRMKPAHKRLGINYWVSCILNVCLGKEIAKDCDIGIWSKTTQINIDLLFSYQVFFFSSVDNDMWPHKTLCVLYVLVDHLSYTVKSD